MEGSRTNFEEEEDWKEAFLSGKHEVGGKNSSFLQRNAGGKGRKEGDQVFNAFLF